MQANTFSSSAAAVSRYREQGDLALRFCRKLQLDGSFVLSKKGAQQIKTSRVVLRRENSRAKQQKRNSESQRTPSEEEERERLKAELRERHEASQVEEKAEDVRRETERREEANLHSTVDFRFTLRQHSTSTTTTTTENTPKQQ